MNHNARTLKGIAVTILIANIICIPILVVWIASEGGGGEAIAILVAGIVETLILVYTLYAFADITENTTCQLKEEKTIALEAKETKRLLATMTKALSAMEQEMEQLNTYHDTVTEHLNSIEQVLADFSKSKPFAGSQEGTEKSGQDEKNTSTPEILETETDVGKAAPSEEEKKAKLYTETCKLQALITTSKQADLAYYAFSRLGDYKDAKERAAQCAKMASELKQVTK